MSNRPSGQHRTNIPYRNPEPPLAHTKPKGRWTIASGFPSYRSGYCVSYWGFEQHQFLTLAEVNPTVSSIRARPETLEWFDGSKWIEHTPDFGVWTDHGCGLFDIESPAAFQSPMSQLRAKALARSLARSGTSYRTVPRNELKIQPRLGNSKDVNSCSGLVFPDGEDSRVFTATPAVGSDTVSGIAMRSRIPVGEAFAAILNLVWRGVLKIDMGTEFSHASMVRRPLP
ncbi:hypothetical protein DBIPINDM_007929 (plasmid) [Mesorhizobium sp. AR02]|uniref:hypothetical protein n=1 Tax=Mesorhizobium sp. AR02 TaxID=2865837 RepID=UPI00215DE650|nr:hypothetical protein [Mesorhizobium sp. AR02]UVK49851.1 hypothetical protein DBIPINDM_007929 [Mesorhizobium sp. AR02]